MANEIVQVTVTESPIEQVIVNESAPITQVTSVVSEPTTQDLTAVVNNYETPDSVVHVNVTESIVETVEVDALTEEPVIVNVFFGEGLPNTASNGFTFVQDTQPTASVVGQTWYDVVSGESFVWFDGNWIQTSYSPPALKDRWEVIHTQSNSPGTAAQTVYIENALGGWRTPSQLRITWAGHASIDGGLYMRTWNTNGASMTWNRWWRTVTHTDAVVTAGIGNVTGLIVGHMNQYEMTRSSGTVQLEHGSPVGRWTFSVQATSIANYGASLTRNLHAGGHSDPLITPAVPGLDRFDIYVQEPGSTLSHLNLTVEGLYPAGVSSRL